jgi:hypothetical protein
MSPRPWASSYVCFPRLERIRIGLGFHSAFLGSRTAHLTVPDAALCLVPMDFGNPCGEPRAVVGVRLLQTVKLHIVESTS